MFRGRRSRRSLVSVALAGALLLTAACTGDAQTDPDPTTTTSPAPTPTPTPTPSTAVDVTIAPERPAAMDGPPTVEGAVDVAEYFLALYPYAYATGDLAAWQALSDDECVFCRSVSDGVTAMQGMGHRQIGGVVTVKAIVGSEIDPQVAYGVDVTAAQSPAQELDASGAVVDVGEASEFTLVFAIRWNGAWSVREVDVHQVDS